MARTPSASEAARLAELRRFNILDTPPEDAFDRLTAAAAQVFGVPVSFLSFVDSDRVWIKSVRGVSVTDVSREASFGNAVAAGDRVLVVSDAPHSSRWRNHPLVKGGPRLVFLAGAPLRSRGYTIGALCIADTKPGKLSDAQSALLQSLADVAVSLVETRREAPAAAPSDMAESESARLLQQERSLFNGGPTVVFKWKAAAGWPVEHVSANVRQFGYEPDEFLSGRLPYASVVHPDDMARVASEVESYTAAAVESFTQEYRIRCRNGEVRWVFDFTTVIRDPTGKVTHYHGYVLDISARKTAEDAQRESTAHYAAVVESFDALVYVCSEDYKVEFMNRRLIERTGYDGVGQDCFKAIHSRDDICPWCVNDTVFQGKTVKWEIQSPKDGRWYYVVNTPIVHPDGSKSKMAVIQDITERKQADEAVRRRDAILEAIGYVSEQLIRRTDWEQCIHDVLGRLAQAMGASRAYLAENSTGPDGAIRSTRRHGWAAAGVSSELYNPDLRDMPLRSQGFGRWADALSRGQIIDGHVREFPESERKLMGALSVRSVAVVPIFVAQDWWGFIGFEACSSEREWTRPELDALKVAAGLVGAAIQRRAADAALRAGAERHRNLVENVQDFVWETDAKGIFTYCSPRCRQILGYDPQELTGKPLQAARSEAERARVERELNPIIAKQEPISLYRNTRLRKDGREVILESSAVPVRDAAGQFCGYRGVCRDITARAAAESELTRTNRALRALKECDKALLRARDESHFLSTICRSMIEQAGYRLCWIGFAQDDPEKSVRPAAQAGFDEGYLESLHLSWADNEHGRGPTGTAIRTGKSAVCQDTARDPNYAPWRAAATQRGYRSSLALPIIDAGGKVIGAFNLYATEANAFNRDEMHLLEEVTQDIAYGLVVLRERRERSEAAEALRKLDERNRVTLSAIPDLVFRINTDGVFLDFSAKDTGELVVPPDQIIGRHVRETLPPDVAAQSEEHIRLALATGQLQVYNYQLEIQGRVRFYEARMVVSGADEVLVIVRDISERKKAESELLKLSNAVNQTADSIVITDSNGVIEYVNPAFVTMTGYTAAEAVGNRPSILKSGRHGQAFYEDLWRRLSKGEVVRAEFINRRKNGEIYYQAETITPLRDAEGRIVRYVSSGRDTTERIRAAEALRESQQRMADIINFLPDATFVIDRAGRVIAWNRATELMTGVPAKDIVGKANYEYAVPFYGHRRPILVDLLLHPAENVERDYTYIEKGRDTIVAEAYLPALPSGGIHAWATAAPLYDANGEIAGAIESIRDVTDRKRADEAIRKLAAFPQYSPNPVLEFDADGRITYFNDAAREAATELAKDSPAEMLPSGHTEIVRECLATAKSRQGIEVTIGRRTYVWSFFPVVDSRTVHGYGFDTTERLNMEAQIRHLQKMEAVGRLAGGVAHDFNNILTAILGYSSILLLEEDLKPDVAEQLKEISKAADRASQLTRQLLAFSRRQLLQPKTLSLNDVINSLGNMLRRIIGEDISLHLVLDPHLPSIHADQAMIEQVIVNLAINARDAMPGGGKIAVGTGTATVSEDVARDNPEAAVGRFVTLTITDTGCGMSEDIKAKIFEPFFTTKEDGRGTGLGLATAYGIVKQHGGWIDVASEERKGSTFIVYLPVHAAPQVKESPPEAHRPRIAGGTETILLVEDEQSVRQLASSVLRQYGYTVLEAASASEALSLWRAHRDEIRLLLSDVIMPGGKTGGELAIELNSDKKDLKVILTSGYNLDSVGQKFSLLPGMAFLPKPFSPEKLARQVRQSLDA